MSQAMLSILMDDQLGSRLAQSGKKKIKQFDTKVITRRYEQLFEEVMGENGKINNSMKFRGL